MASIDTFNPILILGIGDKLFAHAENLPDVFGVDKFVHRTFMYKGVSRIGKLMTNRDIFPDDIVERDSAGPQLVLER